MMKQVMWMCVLALSAVMQAEPVNEKNCTVIVTDEKGNGIRGVRLELFADADFTVPYEACPETEESGADGMIAVPASGGELYMRLKDAVPGYWKTKGMLEEGETVTVSLEPVSAGFRFEAPEDAEVPEDAEFELEKDGTVYAAWTAKDKEIPAEKLCAGETYTVRMKEEPAWFALQNPEVSLPEYRPNEPFVPEMRLVPYGTVTLSCGSGEETPSMALYGLYEDEDCETELLELAGNEEEPVRLPEGTYYIRQKEIAEDWYLEREVRTLHAEAKKAQTFRIEETPVETLLYAEEDVPAAVIADGEEKRITIPKEGIRIKGKRGGILRAVPEDRPGYFRAEPVEVTYGEEAPESSRLCVPVHPFSVSVSVQSLADGVFLSGGTVVIRDGDGKDVQTLSAGRKAQEVKGLQCGTTYTFSLKEPFSFWYGIRSKEIRIPETYSTEKGDVFAAQLFCRPYSLVRIQAEDGGILSGKLYTDEACRNEAYDIHGQPAYAGAKAIPLDEGIYYLKPDAVPPEYCLPDGGLRADCFGQGQNDIPVSLTPVSCTVRITDTAGEPVPGGVVQILDPGSGKILAQTVLTEGEAVFGNDILRRGMTYVVRQASASRHRLRCAEDTEFTIPDSSREAPVLTLTNAHYTTVYLHVESGVERCEAVYGLFESEADTEPAYDICRRPAVLAADENGDASIEMPDGSWIVRQIRNTPGTYRDEKTVRLDPEGQDTAGIQRYETETALAVHIKDPAGQYIPGIQAQIIRSDGTAAETWESESGPYTAYGLPAGETVCVRIVSAPDTVRFESDEVQISVPAAQPQEMPEAVLTGTKLPKPAAVLAHVIPQDPSSPLPWGILTGSGSALLLGIRFLVRRLRKM